MKILYAIPDGIDLGGIITATEAHIAGLKEIGHEVTFVRLRDTLSRGVATKNNKAGYAHEQWAESAIGGGVQAHPLLGWTGPYFSMNNRSDIAEVCEIIKSHDLVIWGFLFGFKNRNTEADPLWHSLFEIENAPSTITILHDDHLWDRQAWIANLDDHAIQGWACVHHASFALSEGLAGRRALIFNGHDVSQLRERKFRPWRLRSGLFSVQNAKPWKRVDKYVGMSRHLNVSAVKAVLAGDGIEVRYMRSKDKCKPQYMDGGRSIWSMAEYSGNFEYVGPVGESVRNDYMECASFLCDFSTRRNAGMFNRVFVEAALRGCVTIANPKFMSGENGEANDLLRPYEHYLPVDTTASHQEIAEQILQHWGQTTSRKYTEMQENLRDLCTKHFDRRRVAEQLVRLGSGQAPTGFAFVPQSSKGGVGRLYYCAGGNRDSDKAERAFSDMMRTFGQAFTYPGRIT